MKLLTKEICRSLPPLYSQDGKGMEAMAWVKFFTPDSNWTWWASEADALITHHDKTHQIQVPLREAVNNAYDDVIFFGLVQGMETEMGYFTLAELQSARGPLGLSIERDIHWTPRPLKDCA